MKIHKGTKCSVGHDDGAAVPFKFARLQPLDFDTRGRMQTCSMLRVKHNRKDTNAVIGLQVTLNPSMGTLKLERLHDSGKTECIPRKRRGAEERRRRTNGTSHAQKHRTRPHSAMDKSYPESGSSSHPPPSVSRHHSRAHASSSSNNNALTVYWRAVLIRLAHSRQKHSDLQIGPCIASRQSWDGLKAKLLKAHQDVRRVSSQIASLSVDALTELASQAYGRWSLWVKTCH